ncbi:MAG: hypothetical protein RRY79_04055 [Clostridia bacterium]
MYTTFVSTEVTSKLNIPWWTGAIGMTLSTVLLYCNGNNPSLPGKY